MDALTIGAIIGAVTQLAGPVIGKILGDLDKDRALQLIMQSRDRYGKIDLPKLTKLTEVELKTQALGPSALEGLKEDPAMLAERLASDEQLRQASLGGLTAADKLSLQQALSQVGRGVRQTQAQLEGQLASRGALDSGAQLAASLAAGQSGVQALGSTAAQAQADASRRAYQALLQRGSNVRGDIGADWARKSQVASAQDAISKYNADLANAANRFAAEQAIDVQKYNAGLPQQDFQNRMTLAGAQGNADANLANIYSGQAAQTQNMWTGIGQAAGQGAAAVGKAVDWDKNPSKYSPGQPYTLTPEEYQAWMTWKSKGGK